MLSSVTAAGMTLEALAICTAASLLLGLIVAFVHTKTSHYTKNFAVTLVILPMLVQSVMMMVNGNLGTGVAILGAFSLVRFRSIPGTSREIVSVFFAMAVGLATGTGFVGFAVLATLVVSLVLLALHWLHVFDSSDTSQTLQVTMPENINHQDALQPVFDNHKVEPNLVKIKTKNMGSLYELTYSVNLPSSVDRKRFIDDLRVRNGNLSIVLFEREVEGGL